MDSNLLKRVHLLAVLLLLIPTGSEASPAPVRIVGAAPLTTAKPPPPEDNMTQGSRRAVPLLFKYTGKQFFSFDSAEVTIGSRIVAANLSTVLAGFVVGTSLYDEPTNDLLIKDSRIAVYVTPYDLPDDLPDHVQVSVWVSERQSDGAKIGRSRKLSVTVGVNRNAELYGDYETGGLPIGPDCKPNFLRGKSVEKIVGTNWQPITAPKNCSTLSKGFYRSHSLDEPNRWTGFFKE